jgi:hypothetical protein
MDLTIRIKLLTIDSITLLNCIFDTNRIDNQFDLFREYIYQANKGLYSLNLEGLLFCDNKFIVLAKIFDKKPLIIVLIREIYTQKSLVYLGVIKTKKLLKYSYY